MAFLATLGLGEEIGSAVDINPYKHDKLLSATGHLVQSSESLRPLQSDTVILMNPLYTTEVRGMLDGMGLHPEILPV